MPAKSKRQRISMEDLNLADGGQERFEGLSHDCEAERFHPPKLSPRHGVCMTGELNPAMKTANLHEPRDKNFRPERGCQSPEMRL